MQAIPVPLGPKVVVIGATGRTGKHIVRKLVERKQPCTLAVRSIEKAKASLPANEELCTFVQADLMDKGSLSRVLEGSNVILYAAGSNNLLGVANSKDSAKRVDYEGFNLLVDACKSVATRPHLIMCSSILVTSTWHPLALLINGMTGGALYWKFYGEEHLRKSGVRYTIVRPGGLLDTEGTTGLVVGQGDTTRGRISRADVAEVMIQCMTREATLGSVTFEVIASTVAGTKLPQSEAEWNALFAPLKKDA